MNIQTLPIAVLLSLGLAACAGKASDTGAAEPAGEPATPEPGANAADEADEADGADEAEEEEEPEDAADELVASTDGNLLEVLRKTPDASRFLEELEKAGLERRLVSTDEDVTAIIPTNAAFESMSKAVAAKMKKPAEAAKILQYHLVPEKMDLNRVMDHGSLPTLLGKFMPVKVVEGTTLYFGDSKAKLIDSNITASNGMAHTIDQVLMPK